MDGISPINTGLAAVALTAASRLLEALIRKSNLFKSKIEHVEDHSLAARVRIIEKRLRDEDSGFRLDQLEIQAKRHGWEVGSNGNG